MKFDDMQKPLVQSALVILAILVVIGFVAGSGAESFFGGIVSIVKGVIYTILFAFALVLGLVFSVVLLIAIFLGAVSLYSSEKAKEMFAGLKQRTTVLYQSLTHRPAQKNNMAEAESTSPGHYSTAQPDSIWQQDARYATTDSLSGIEKKLSSEIAGLKQHMDTLKDKNSSLDTSFGTLQDAVSSLPGADVIQRIDQIEGQQEKIVVQLEECLSKLETMSGAASTEKDITTTLSKDIQAVQEDLKNLSQDVEEIRASFSQRNEDSSEELPVSTDDEEHRIFAYLEKESDKKQFAKCVVDAVEKNLTYAEIDDFLTKSLPKKIDTIIKDHPSLTKEFIRECKSK